MHFTKALFPVIALLLALPATAQDVARPATISITGTASVSAEPDIAYVTSGVTTQGATAREALDANTAAMTELVELLKSSGIENRDIQTSGFNVQPQYVYSDKRDANGYTLPPQISGYQVSNTVTIRIRELEALGTILDQSVTVGANTINSVSFSVDDPSELLDEARKKAVANAMAKAKLYTEAAGIGLGPIVAITENGGNPPQPYMMRAKAMDMVAEAAPVPVQAGEMEFSISVNMSWELAQ